MSVGTKVNTSMVLSKAPSISWSELSFWIVCEATLIAVGTCHCDRLHHCHPIFIKIQPHSSKFSGSVYRVRLASDLKKKSQERADGKAGVKKANNEQGWSGRGRDLWLYVPSREGTVRSTMLQNRPWITWDFPLSSSMIAPSLFRLLSGTEYSTSFCNLRT